jgi:transcriptional regulator with XRE-family HTH domain
MIWEFVAELRKAMVSQMIHELGQRIRQVRESAGHDQETFGRAVGATRNTVYRWEKGLASPPANILFKMYQEYGTDLHWLVTGEDCMKSVGDEALSTQPQHPDSDKLRKVIVQVEAGISRSGAMLDPDKKARLIIILYDYSIGTGKPIGPELVDQYLSLVV